jgi:exoribonuclease-2
LGERPFRIPAKSLVVYKGQSARVNQGGEKFDIELSNGKTLKVRDKDIIFLHPGPFEFPELKEDLSQLEDAWELSMGETLNLRDLGELLCGADTPAAIWSAWSALQNGLYFHGTPDKVEMHNHEQVTDLLKQREQKQQELERKIAFSQRLKDKKFIDEDRDQLRNVEGLALGEDLASDMFKELKLQPLPHVAHQWLIDYGIWDKVTNLNAIRALRKRDLQPKSIIEIPQDHGERMDLTHLTAWAIDDQDSHDPDDAISLEGERLWVHISDVADLIPIDSECDLEARERSANLYLPEWTSPMIPPNITLSRGLGLQETSPALSFEISFENGQAQLHRAGPSMVKVTRTSYEAVDEAIGHHEGLVDIQKICLAFDAQRRKKGSLELNLPEIKISASNPDHVDIKLLCKSGSRLLVKNAMLMCGQAVAKFSRDHDISLPYSCQKPPSIDDDSRTFNPELLLDAVQLRRHMQPSELKLSPDQHAGLGLNPYTQCTSPLRRYSDLLVHQQLRGYWSQGKMRTAEELQTALTDTKQKSRWLRKCERLSKQHWTLVWLSQQKAWQGEARVISVEDRGIMVLIESLAFEQKVLIDRSVEVGELCQLKLKHVDFIAGKAQFNAS